MKPSRSLGPNHAELRSFIILMEALSSANVSALGLDVHRIKRLAGSHEQTISLWATEANVTANLRQENLSDELAVRRKHMHPVVARADPTGAGPNVSVQVRANAISATSSSAMFRFLIRRHKLASVADGLSINHVPDGNVP